MYQVTHITMYDEVAEHWILWHAIFYEKYTSKREPRSVSWGIYFTTGNTYKMQELKYYNVEINMYWWSSDNGGTVSKKVWSFCCELP